VITVFFSYAHHDEALRNELEKHLAMLKRQGVIDTWHDRKIDAGQDVYDQYGNIEGGRLSLDRGPARHLEKNRGCWKDICLQ
jgi:hypothetical protein